MELEGKDIDITIKEHKSKRTDPQNSYLWVLHGLVSKRTKILYKEKYLTPDEIHEYALQELSYVIKGDGIKVVQRSSKMNTARFAQFIEDYKKWACETFDIPYLPEASERYE